MDELMEKMDQAQSLDELVEIIDELGRAAADLAGHIYHIKHTIWRLKDENHTN